MASFRKRIDAEIGRRMKTGSDGLVNLHDAKGDLLFWVNSHMLFDRWWPVWADDEGHLTRWNCYCDASATGGGFRFTTSSENFDDASQETASRGTIVADAWYPFDDALVEKGSGVRELHCMTEATEAALPLGIQEGSKLTFYVDARVAAAGAQGRAKAEDLAHQARQFCLAVLKLPRVALRVVWVPRSIHVVADSLSRRAMGPEFAELDAEFLEKTFTAWKHRPTLDAFANASQAKAPTYYTMVPDARAAGYDAFQCTPEPGSFVYAFPPPQVADRFCVELLQKWSATCCLLLVIPVETARRYNLRGSPVDGRVYKQPPLNEAPRDCPQPFFTIRIHTPTCHCRETPHVREELPQMQQSHSY